MTGPEAFPFLLLGVGAVLAHLWRDPQVSGLLALLLFYGAVLALIAAVLLGAQ